MRRELADLDAVVEDQVSLDAGIAYGAYWGLAVASDTLDAAALPPAQLRQRLAGRRLPDLRYYNAEVHPALFALPNYYRDLVQPAPLAALPPRAVRVA